MLSYCLKYGKNTKSKVVKTKNGRIMILSKCVVCNSKYRNFLKNKKLEDF